MKTVGATEARDDFGEMLDTAQREPIRITKKDRPVAVLVSQAEYDRLSALEDAVWAAAATEAAKGGFLGKTETERFIQSVLNREG